MVLAVKILSLSAEVLRRSEVLGQWLSFSRSSFLAVLVQTGHRHNLCQNSYIIPDVVRGGFGNALEKKQLKHFLRLTGHTALNILD